MKNRYPYLVCIIALQLFSITVSNAQVAKSDPSVLKTPPANITIDANLKDWGDSLQYFNAENNIRYGFSNDKDNLYFAVRIDDRSEAIRILKAGITLSFDPKGKKKSAYSITFPLNTQVSTPLLTVKQDNFNEVTEADRDELEKEIMTTLRGIKVEGFKDIEGDMITIANTYGIKTAINYDDKGNLVCEASIALKLLHLDDRSKTEWIYDVKINGISRQAPKMDGDNGNAGGGGRGGMSGGGGGRGGMGGGGGRGGRGGGNRQAATNAGTDGGILAKSIDFSGKFYLSNAQ